MAPNVFKKSVTFIGAFLPTELADCFRLEAIRKNFTITDLLLQMVKDRLRHKTVDTLIEGIAKTTITNWEVYCKNARQAAFWKFENIVIENLRTRKVSEELIKRIMDRVGVLYAKKKKLEDAVKSSGKEEREKDGKPKKQV